ncbi:hypothetical protein CIT292_06795 [Citrobacter youngae ATCC 29220]|uniref:Uncharacterized protein n=1 Tax=Citrobacter youngae ATCC 29220 TaxID=500640 RepID=D4B8L2_9ENTR|nr:hypothetical protein CIT292_06795 [Citrobacter youngae ATCC 29220]
MVLKNVLRQKFFLCDFTLSRRRKRTWLQNFMLDKNNAQQEMPKQRVPRRHRHM